MKIDPITKFYVERKARPVVEAALSDTRVVLVSARVTWEDHARRRWPRGSSPEID